jgi:acetylornithine deacetylase
VAEPTRALPVTAHRGIATCTGTFRGTPGHASSPRALVDSAVHEAVRWATLALQEAGDAEQESFGDLSGIRFNLGRIEGGVKPNMIAGEATVRFGVRPLPSQDPQALLQRLWNLSPDSARVEWQAGFIAPPLKSDIQGVAVDFWTEAALFGEAGYAAMVLGPGDIAQAHTPGEWVALDQLDLVTKTYAELIEGRA